MVEKFQNNHRLRFLLVGAGATVLDFSLLFLFRFFGLPTIAANYPATTIAMLASFVANRRFTFRAHGANLKKQLILFFTVTLFALWIIQPIVIAIVEPFAVSHLSAAYAAFIAKLCATATSLVWNYTLYSRIVFPENHRNDGDS